MIRNAFSFNNKETNRKKKSFNVVFLAVVDNEKMHLMY